MGWRMRGLLLAGPSPLLLPQCCPLTLGLGLAETSGTPGKKDNRVTMTLFEVSPEGTLPGSLYYGYRPHFINGETEAPRGTWTCSRSQSLESTAMPDTVCPGPRDRPDKSLEAGINCPGRESPGLNGAVPGLPENRVSGSFHPAPPHPSQQCSQQLSSQGWSLLQLIT